MWTASFSSSLGSGKTSICCHASKTKQKNNSHVLKDNVQIYCPHAEGNAMTAPYHRAVQEATRVPYTGIPTQEKQSTAK